jgi:carnitine O-acetyltransferase
VLVRKTNADMPVVEDGYGLSYAIGDNEIRWCVTTKNNDAEKFGKALSDAAEEIQAMMERAGSANL